MKVNFSQMKWKTDEIVIDGKPHNRAVAIINGKNVCIVKQKDSQWVSVWVGSEAGVVRENGLRSWIVERL